VPVAAAGQAEVGAADPHPLVLLRGGKHPLHQFPVGLLDGVAVGERAVRFADAAGERVAHFLQLTEPEHPRRSRSRDPVRHGDPAEPRGDRPGKLELELADLTPQLGASKTLIYLESFKHSPHGLILSALEGRCSNP
jgi:hypothetical protein